MSNELYMTLVYRPHVSSMGRAFQSTRRTRLEIAKAQSEAIRVMDEKTALVDRVLRGFDPTLLGSTMRHGREYSELAEFLGYLVNGTWRPVPMHAGPLYRTLPTSRLSFGTDKLEIRNGDRRRYAAFVDIHEYADAVEPGVLNLTTWLQSNDGHTYCVVTTWNDSKPLDQRSFEVLVAGLISALATGGGQ